LSSRYVPQGLDIRELRAVYACLPKEFQLDSDGRKKLWRDDCRNKVAYFFCNAFSSPPAPVTLCRIVADVGKKLLKLAGMIEKEKNNSLPKFEAMAAAYRPKEEKKAMAASTGSAPASGGGKKLDAGALGAMLAGRGAGGPPAPKLDTSALQNALASKLAGGLPKVCCFRLG